MDFNKPSFGNENLQEKKEVKSLDEILKELGFKESEEMKVLAGQISEKMKTGEEFVDNLTAYQDLGVKMIKALGKAIKDQDVKTPEDRAENTQRRIQSIRIEFAMQIRNAMIFLDGGNTEAYEYYVQDALNWEKAAELADIMPAFKELLSK